MKPNEKVKKLENVGEMSEDEQISLALEQSIKDSEDMQQKLEEEEEKQLLQALEASMTSNHSLEIQDGQTAKTCDFQLTGVISHLNYSDSVESGHYVANVYEVGLKEWFKYDDMIVSLSSLSSVIRRASLDGCLLFFSNHNVINYFNTT